MGRADPGRHDEQSTFHFRSRRYDRRPAAGLTRFEQHEARLSLP